MVTDPVCKMTIEEKDAVGTSTYKGETYYFCSSVCEEDFDKNPEGFLAEKAILLPTVSAGATGMAKRPHMRNGNSERAFDKERNRRKGILFL